MVPPVKANIGQWIATFIPSMDIVTAIAGGKIATIAAEDVNPFLVFTDLTVSWIAISFGNVNEVVVVTADPQSLLELCQLLLARTRVRGKVLVDATSCTDIYASRGTCFKVRLVVVTAVAVPPLGPATIAKLCFTTTTVAFSAVSMGGSKLCRTYRMWWQP